MKERWLANETTYADGDDVPTNLNAANITINSAKFIPKLSFRSNRLCSSWIEVGIRVVNRKEVRDENN